jgi:hypothetical protein
MGMRRHESLGWGSESKGRALLAGLGIGGWGLGLGFGVEAAVHVESLGNGLLAAW